VPPPPVSRLEQNRGQAQAAEWAVSMQLEQWGRTERQKKRAQSLELQEVRNLGCALSMAVKKSPCLFSSWHQFSNFLKMGYICTHPPVAQPQGTQEKRSVISWFNQPPVPSCPSPSSAYVQNLRKARVHNLPLVLQSCCPCL